MKRAVVIASSFVLVGARAAVAQAPPPGSDATADAAVEPPSTEPAVGYDKGFFLATPDDKFKLVIQARLQTRWEAESIDEGDTRTEETAFSIARARITLAGHVFSPDIEYKFQSDFGKGAVVLKDFYVDYTLPTTSIRVRAGQWKRPFSRQQITSSGSLETVDRAITDKFFESGRDIGVALHNNYEKSPQLEWAAGVFNGTGETPILGGDVIVDPMTGEGTIVDGAFSNVPERFSPAFVARLGYNHGGIKGYSEADLEGGPFRVAVAASGLTELESDDGDESAMRAELDYVAKLHGLSTTGGVYVSSAQDGDSMMAQDLAAIGFHVQAGYAIARKLQPLVRYALIAPTGQDNELQELTAGLSLYSISHNFKWQTDASLLSTSDPMAATTSDYRVRSQLQLAF